MKQRKFTNGYHTGYSDDCDKNRDDDNNCENVKESKTDDVVKRTENMEKRWSKIKNLRKDESKYSEIINCFLKGKMENQVFV